MKEHIKADAFTDPFPHVIFHNFYNDSELKLIWEELDFYTKPGKLLSAKEYGGVVTHTNSKALWLDKIYLGKYRELSNICLLYTSPSPRDRTRSRMPSSA